MRLSTKFILLEMLLLLLFIFGVIWFIFLAVKNQRSKDNNAVDNVMQNWKTDFFSDIQVTKNECSKLGKNWKEIFTYNFSGTTDPYCLCNDDFLNDRPGNSYTSNCKTRLGNSARVGCQLLSPIKSKELKQWKGGQHICGKAVPGANFFNLASQNHGKCPDDKISCGNIDKPSELICLTKKKFPECPVSDISFDGNNLVISKKGKLPLVQFEIREDGVCTDVALDTKTKGRDVPDILKSPKYDAEDEDDFECERDPRWEVQDSWSEHDFFKENDLPMKELKPTGLASEKYKYNLMTRNVVKLAPKCRDRMSSIDVQEDTLLKSIWFKITLLVLVCIFIALIIMDFLSAWLRKILFWFIRAIVAISLMFIIAIAMGYLWYRTPSHYKDLRKFEEDDCSDEFTNKELKEVGDNFAWSAKWLLFGFFWALLFAIAYTAVVFLHKFLLGKNNRHKGENRRPVEGEESLYMDGAGHVHHRDSFGDYQELIEQDEKKLESKAEANQNEQSQKEKSRKEREERMRRKAAANAN